MTRTDYLLVIAIALTIGLAGVCQADDLDWTTYTSADSGLEDDAVQCVCGDATGRVWIGLTSDGVNVFDGSSWLLYNTANSGLKSNSIRMIAIDDNDVKWIATLKGLTRFDEEGWVWTTYQTADSNIPSNDVKDAALDRFGNVWLATAGGVSKFDGYDFTNYTKSNSDLPTSSIRSIATARNGDVWVGMFDEGAAVLREGVWTTFSPVNSRIAGHDIYDIMIDRASDAWFACNDGSAISVFNGVDWTTHDAGSSSFTGDEPVSISQHSDGSIWFGTDGDGVFMLYNSIWTQWNEPITPGLGSSDIRHIGFQSDGTVWAATSAGLSYLPWDMPNYVEASVYTDKDGYFSGETLRSFVNAYNHTDTDIFGSFFISMEWPNGKTLSWWSGTPDVFPIPLTLGAGMVLEGYPLYETQLSTMMMLKGTYKWELAFILDGASNVLATDTCTFTLQ